MTRTQAQRLRFGVLAARHVLERDRLTPDQIDYLENCERVYGWRKSDSIDAYQHEEEAALKRMLPKKESPNVGL